MKNIKVKYSMTNHIIGEGVLKSEREFTKRLITYILEESDKEIENTNNYFNDSRLILKSKEFSKYDSKDYIIDSGDHNGVTYKNSVFDLRIEIENKANLDLEIEAKKKDLDLGARISYYQGLLISKSLPNGLDYSSLRNTLTIWLCDFNISKKPITTFLNMTTDNKVLPYSRIILVDLTKLKSCANMKLEELLDFFKSKSFNNDKWTGDEVMSNTIKKIQELNSDKEVLRQIEIEEKLEHDYQSEIKYHEFLGRQEGIQVGRQEGIQVGRQEGIQVGEEKANYKNAIAMYKVGVSLDIILKNFDVEEEKLLEMIKENK